MIATRRPMNGALRLLSRVAHRPQSGVVRYQRHLQVNQKERSVSMDPPVERLVSSEPPPPTGFGSDEDSLGSWRSIRPKVS